MRIWIASLIALYSMSASAEYPLHVYASRGNGYSCVLTDQGRVKCWGDNSYYGVVDRTGNVGYVKASPTLPFLDLDQAHHGPVRQLALGNLFACALFNDGEVVCWGNGQNGQLGIGSKDTLPANLEPVHFESHRGPAVEIGAGSYGACARFKKGQVQCWGGSESELPHTIDLGKGTKAISLSVGARHQCVVTQKHRVKCWIANKQLQMTSGQDQNKIEDVPLKLEPDESIESVSAGAEHTCVVIRSSSNPIGKGRCWGRNYDGELGIPYRYNTTQMADQLQSIPDINFGMPNDPLLRLEAGLNRTCALFKSGRVKCFGDNYDGGLGTESRSSVVVKADNDPVPSAPISIAPETKLNVSEISVGDHHTCAMVEIIHAMKCWGSNYGYALGFDDRRYIGARPGDMGANLPYIDVGL